MAQRKQETWTRRCPDGRACAPIDWEKFKALLPRAAAKARKNNYADFRLMSQTNFIPDDYDVCDYCLTAIYGLEARHDDCDREGLGPEYFERDAVLNALRKARGRG